jgi:hypothetical protein
MHKNKYLKKSFSEKEFFLDETPYEEKKDFLTKQDFLKKGKSLINGIGIFTSIVIPANELFYLIPLNDIRLVPTMRAARIATNKFVFDEKVLNYINHSCNANSEIVLEQQRVLLRAKRDICVGEEITLDYTMNEEKNNLILCNCGEKKCRNFFFTT